jgi:outer membrane protein assembly factor BamB
MQGEARSDERQHIGSISAQLELGDVPIDQLSWTLYGGPYPYQSSGTFDVRGDEGTFTGVIPNVAEGSNYQLVISASTSTEPAAACDAISMPFDVVRGSRVALAMHLLCEGQTDRSGAIAVSGDANACPTADGIEAPPSAEVGDSIMLVGHGHDSDQGPSALELTWSVGVGEGNFDDVHSANPLFTCQRTGRHSVTLTVSDGDRQCAARYPGDVQLTIPIDCASSGATGSATAYQINPSHSGFQANDSLLAPLTLKWDTDIGAPLSYPLIADGLVFVAGTHDQIVYAFGLAADNGMPLWGPSGLTNAGQWAGMAYDDGRLYSQSTDGWIDAVDPASGASIWGTKLGGLAFTSPPTASDGIVYVAGGPIDALDGASGRVLWTNGISQYVTMPTVGPDALYLAYGCEQASSLDLRTGALSWQVGDSCSNTGATSALAGERLYVRDSTSSSGTILDARNGQTLGGFSASQLPAIDDAGRSFIVSGSQLQARQLDGQSLWTFNADSALSPPVSANGFVYVASQGGLLYAIDVQTGAAQTTPLPAPFDVNAAVPTALAIGGGMLLVPAGTHLLAFE